jgi:hypothetical protein
MSSIQNSEVVFDYMEPPEAFSEELRQLEKERTEQLKKMDEPLDQPFRAGWHCCDSSLARILCDRRHQFPGDRVQVRLRRSRTRARTRWRSCCLR